MTISNSSIIGVDLDSTSTTQLFALGTHVQGSNNSEWVYVQIGATAVTAYKAVAFNNAYTCGMASVTDLLNGLQIGVAQTAMATGSFGWVAIRGNSLGVLGSSSVTATAQGIFLHGTGLVDNAVSASGTLAGISFVSVAQTAGVTVSGCLLSWPRGGAPGM